MNPSLRLIDSNEVVSYCVDTSGPILFLVLLGIWVAVCNGLIA